jgi:hypothetical protein
MKKSRTVPHPAAVETARHLPLVDLLIEARSELFELAVRSGLKHSFPIIRHDMALSLVHQRRDDEALALLQAAPDEPVPTVSGVVTRALRLALEGRSADAAALLQDDLVQGAADVEFWAWWVSECYAFIGEDALALDWLERAFSKGFRAYPYLSEHSSVFARLHGQPRCRTLLVDIKRSWEEFHAI